jgi:hypothetical protein
MSKKRYALTIIAIGLAAFTGGRWSRSGDRVKADSGETPQVDIRQISGGTSLVVYYPTTKKLFVYQNPFVGLPTWGCSYSVQLSTPGGTINRQPCPPASQSF